MPAKGGIMIGSLTRRSVATIAATLICCGLLTGASRGAVVSTPTMFGNHGNSNLFTASRPAASLSQAGLNGTVATSGTNAWAVGGTNAGSTLIMHWNGTAWKKVASPTPAGGGDLLGVAKVPSGGLWAVGYTGASPSEPLILMRNGTTWAQTASPSIAG